MDMMLIESMYQKVYSGYPELMPKARLRKEKSLSAY